MPDTPMVKTKFGDNIVVTAYDCNSNLCYIGARAIGRSSIISSDDEIRRCVSAAQRAKRLEESRVLVDRHSAVLQAHESVLETNRPQ